MNSWCSSSKEEWENNVVRAIYLIDEGANPTECKKQLKQENKKGESDNVVEMDTQRQRWSHAIAVV